MAEGTGLRARRVRVSFSTIRSALSNEDLLALLKDNYINRLVTLDVYTPRTDEDDLFVETSPIKATRVLSSRSTPPSERHIEAIERYQNEGTIDEETLLAYYFILFKRFFKEEDPNWVGKTSTGAINQIRQFVSLHTTYPDALLYLQKLFPLWVKRLKEGAKFPTNRPTLNNFFPSGEKKFFWTNRNLLYRQWKESPVKNDDQD